MSPDNTQLLQSRYPELYGARANTRPIYFEVDDGWFGLLDDLSAKIMGEWKKQGGTQDFTVFQVKQKFGGLRFYASGDLLNEVHGFIEEAARKADVSCEVCGAPGTLTGRGYVQCLCPVHNTEQAR